MTMLMPPPPRGEPAEMDAFSGRSAFCTPKQFGPTSRTPPARAAATASACSLAPAGPVSANPPLSTTVVATPLAAASATMSGTVAAGVRSRPGRPGPGRRAGRDRPGGRHGGRRADRQIAGEVGQVAATATAQRIRPGRRRRPGRPVAGEHGAPAGVRMPVLSGAVLACRGSKTPGELASDEPRLADARAGRAGGAAASRPDRRRRRPALAGPRPASTGEAGGIADLGPADVRDSGCEPGAARRGSRTCRAR